MTFDTSLLDEALSQQETRWERLRRETLKATLSLLDEIGPRYGVAQAYLFGSLVKAGRFHEGSDVDVAVTDVEPEAFFGLMGALSLALGRDVDLVDLRRCHFAQRIRAEGVLWTRRQ